MSPVRVAFFASAASRSQASTQIAALLGDPPESAGDDLAAQLMDTEGGLWWAGCGAFGAATAEQLVQVAATIGCPAFAWSDADGAPFRSSVSGPAGPWSYSLLLNALGLATVPSSP